MTEMNDIALLREYAERGAEAAFAEIVRRHVNLVYSVALRYSRQGADAEDITQSVFALLARKAGRLREGTVLTGWLYETTRFKALQSMRTNTRRHIREQTQAQIVEVSPEPDGIWRQLAPLLEEAMTRLSERDRTLLALRFFENKTGAETAAALGIGEGAARKRIERAVEKLRMFFARRGVAVSAGALTAAISAHSVQAAPIALATSVTAAAMAEGAVAGSLITTIVTGAVHVMSLSKVKIGVAGIVVAASVATPLVIQSSAAAKMREVEETARRQAETVAGLQGENERLSNLAAGRRLASAQLQDLEALRTEAARLRQETNEIARLRAEKRRFEAWLRHDQPKTVVQEKEEAMARMSQSRKWVLVFFEYAEKHQGQFPGTFEEAAGLVPQEAQKELEPATELFEIVYHGLLSDVKSPQDVIVLREKEAWEVTTSDNPNVKWAKAYAFADGHSELHMEPENDFSEYERKHIQSKDGG